MNAVGNSSGEFPNLIDNGKLHVHSNGYYFIQSKALKLNNTVNIYIVYRLNPISSTRNTDYTIQNSDSKNTDSSKNNYTSYGLCFDKGGEFGHTVNQGNFNRTASAKNVIIFGVDTSSCIHTRNRASNIYVRGKDFIQGINDTTIYAEKLFHKILKNLD